MVEFILGVFDEEGFGGELDLLALFRGDLLEGGATGGSFAVFDFGEIDVLGVERDNVDFVGFGLEIAGEDGVMMDVLEVVGDDLFGFLAIFNSGLALGAGKVAGGRGFRRGAVG